MRIQLVLSPNIQPVPFSYLQDLRAALHNWLGPNDIHEDLSLYSLGWLKGGEKVGRSLYFPQGATWNLGFYDSDLGWKLAKGIIKDKHLAYGMTVEKALEVSAPRFESPMRFAVDGAVLVRDNRTDGSRECVLWNDIRSEVLLTEKLIQKMKKAGLDERHHTVKVRFDRTYTKAREKVMTAKRMAEGKDIQHKGSVCPVIIEGTPEALHFAWLVGVGDLTGSGFGALI
jgi:CRISPR-associated endoribonuclease Cas6